MIDSDLLSVHGNVDLKKHLKVAEKLTAKDLVVTDSISLPKTGIRKIDNPVGIQMEADTSDPTKYSLSVKNGLLAGTYDNPIDDDETHATTTTLKGVVEIASQFNRTQPATTNRTLLNVWGKSNFKGDIDAALSNMEVKDLVVVGPDPSKKDSVSLYQYTAPTAARRVACLGISCDPNEYLAIKTQMGFHAGNRLRA